MPPAEGSRDNQGGGDGAGILDMLISKLKIETSNEAQKNMDYAYNKGIEDARGQTRSNDLQQRRQATVYPTQCYPFGPVMAIGLASAPVEPRVVRFVLPGTHYIVPGGPHRTIHSSTYPRFRAPCIIHSSAYHHYGAARSRSEPHRILYGPPRSRSEAPRSFYGAPRSRYIEQPRQGTRSRDRGHSSRSRRREKQPAHDSASEEPDHARRTAVPEYKNNPVFKTSDDYILQEANHYEVLGLTRKATYEE
ncbi:MAG: hypothetical protein M1824_003031 [Vezdaea acicularis]|nr:MAG: hypothetical protein M1824_003031 [Vezdaea acicularis]